MRGKTHGDKKLISPALKATNNSNIIYILKGLETNPFTFVFILNKDPERLNFFISFFFSPFKADVIIFKLIY